jgi:hypothetical protein
MMKHPEQLDLIQQRLRKTAEEIEIGQGDSEKNQRILDVADRVREEVAESAKSKVTKKAIADDRVDQAIQDWMVATVLLGAGAEHLSADVKRRLASLVISFSSIIAHRATEVLLQMDFSEVKKKLLKDPDAKAMYLNGDDDKDATSFGRFVNGLVDVLEYILLANNFRRVLEQLCEGARQR